MAGARRRAYSAAEVLCVPVSQGLNRRTVVGGITQVVIDLYVNRKLVGRDSCLPQTAVCTCA
jgi:hypothetical protein